MAAGRCWKRCQKLRDPVPRRLQLCFCCVAFCWCVAIVLCDVCATNWRPRWLFCRYSSHCQQILRLSFYQKDYPWPLSHRSRNCWHACGFCCCQHRQVLICYWLLRWVRSTMLLFSKECHESPPAISVHTTQFCEEFKRRPDACQVAAHILEHHTPGSSLWVPCRASDVSSRSVDSRAFRSHGSCSTLCVPNAAVCRHGALGQHDRTRKGLV